MLSISNILLNKLKMFNYIIVTTRGLGRIALIIYKERIKTYKKKKTTSFFFINIL